MTTKCGLLQSLPPMGLYSCFLFRTSSVFVAGISWTVDPAVPSEVDLVKPSVVGKLRFFAIARGEGLLVIENYGRHEETRTPDLPGVPGRSNRRPAGLFLQSTYAISRTSPCVRVAAPPPGSRTSPDTPK